MGVQVTPQHPTCHRWAQDGITIEQLLQALAVARERKPKDEIPAKYLDAIVRDPTTFQTAKEGGGGRWWATDEGISAKGKELGIPPRPGETYDDYGKRLRESIRKAEEVTT